MDIGIYFDGKTYRWRCIEKEAVPEYICTTRLPSGARIARIEILARGFKKYSKNVVLPQSDTDTSIVDLGEVRLIPSELPIVKQIVHSTGDDGKHKFEITLHNPLNRDFLVQEVSFTAHKPGNGWMCCCPPNSIFELEDQLEITAGGEVGRSISGKFRELVRGEDYTIQASGGIKENGCNGATELFLNLPTSFLLPKSEYTAIHVILPKRFNIVDSRYTFSDIKEKPSPGDVNTVGYFDRVIFSFRTSQDDELEFEGEFKLKN